jgi:hypothetical protein
LLLSRSVLRYSRSVGATTLAAWAKLSVTAAPPLKTGESLEPLRRMVDAAKRDAKAAAQRLDALFAKTDALYPRVGDPLPVKLGLDSNRWLAAEHENSYSDWLAWILGRQNSPSLVLSLFSVSHNPEAEGACSIEREVVTPYGRLDFLLSIPTLGVLCVEVKTESDPGKDQLERYSNWLAGQRAQLGLVLLAINQPEDDPSAEKYSFCSWKHISLTLRTWASAWLRDPSRLYDAVMTLAFCGAIERNLLLLGGGGLNAVRTAEYLEEILDYAKTTSR